MIDMKDYMVRGTAANDELRVFACTSAELVEKARSIHDTTPVVTAALGRLLSAATMMGSMMKGEKDVLTLNLNGDGPVGAVCVTANSKGDVKGFVNNPYVDIPLKPNGKLDVSGAVGKGFLNVIRDTGMKEPYNSSTELVSGEVGDDLSYYFAVSEQTPSSVGVGVLVDVDRTVLCAGGFIVQVMPDASEETISGLEKNISKLSSVTDMLRKGLTPEEVLQVVLEGFDVQIMEKRPIFFDCDCNREKVERAIISVGSKELQSMIDEGKPVETECRFCRKKYVFEIDDLKKML